MNEQENLGATASQSLSVKYRVIMFLLDVAGKLAGNDRAFVAALARAAVDWRDTQKGRA